MPQNPLQHTPQPPLSYLLANQTDFDAFLALPAPTAGSEALPQIEQYLDTTDFQLLRTGYTLAVQADGELLHLTLRNQARALLGNVATTAVERPDAAGTVAAWQAAQQPQRWPKALRTALKQTLSVKTKLQIIACLERTTHHRQLLLPTAAEPLLLALDEVVIRLPQADALPHRQQAGTGAPATIYEVTVVPTNAEQKVTVRDSKTLLAELRRVAAVSTADGSTVGRALQMLSRYPPFRQAASKDASKEDRAGDVTAIVAGIHPTMLITDACRLIWHEQLMVMLCNEAGARFSREIEYVHELRVAIRRARAAAKLYGDFFPRKRLRPFLKVLRETGQRLGVVRDLDVLIAKAQRNRKQQKRGKKGQSALLTQWEAARAEAHAELVAWLESKRYRTFVADFHKFCSTPPAEAESNVATGTGPPLQQIRHVAPTLLMARFAQVRRYEVLFDRAEPMPYATIHALRIDGKYLRYSLEFVRHLLGNEGEALIERLKGLQELLGDLNDAVVAQQMVTGNPRETKRKAAPPAYVEQQERLVLELSNNVPAAFARFVEQESREQLARAVAHL
jgi:CHAD domain-containing protein